MSIPHCTWTTLLPPEIVAFSNGNEDPLGLFINITWKKVQCLQTPSKGRGSSHSRLQRNLFLNGLLRRAQTLYLNRTLPLPSQVLPTTATPGAPSNCSLPSVSSLFQQAGPSSALEAPTTPPAQFEGNGCFFNKVPSAAAGEQGQQQQHCQQASTPTTANEDGVSHGPADGAQSTVPLPLSNQDTNYLCPAEDNQLTAPTRGRSELGRFASASTLEELIGPVEGDSCASENEGGMEDESEGRNGTPRRDSCDSGVCVADCAKRNGDASSSDKPASGVGQSDSAVERMMELCWAQDTPWPPPSPLNRDVDSCYEVETSAGGETFGDRVVGLVKDVLCACEELSDEPKSKCACSVSTVGGSEHSEQGTMSCKPDGAERCCEHDVDDVSSVLGKRSRSNSSLSLHLASDGDKSLSLEGDSDDSELCLKRRCDR